MFHRDLAATTMSERKNRKSNRRPHVSWRDVARFSWNYWRPNKWLGAGSAALMLLSVSMDAVVPVYTGRIVDAMGARPADSDAWKAAWAAFWMFAVLAFLHHALRNGRCSCGTPLPCATFSAS